MTAVRLDACPPIESVGGQITLAITTFDANGDASSAVAPTVTITAPDASTTAVTPIDHGSGCWTAVYTLAAAGRHSVAVSTPEDASLAAVYALGATTAAGMPNVNDCVSYLRQSSWERPAVQDALDAELAAQLARCGARNPYPADLRQALLRRVQRNLAMRMLPLAVNFGDADAGATVLPGNDPEVRRLEAPWRKRRLG